MRWWANSGHASTCGGRGRRVQLRHDDDMMQGLNGVRVGPNRRVRAGSPDASIHELPSHGGGFIAAEVGCSAGHHWTGTLGEESMHVLAFAAAVSTTVVNDRGVTASGFPMTSFYVPRFPTQITVPLGWPSTPRRAATTTRAATSSPRHRTVNGSASWCAPGIGPIRKANPSSSGSLPPS